MRKQILAAYIRFLLAGGSGVLSEMSRTAGRPDALGTLGKDYLERHPHVDKIKLYASLDSGTGAESANVYFTNKKNHRIGAAEVAQFRVRGAIKVDDKGDVVMDKGQPVYFVISQISEEELTALENPTATPAPEKVEESAAKETDTDSNGTDDTGKQGKKGGKK